MARKTLRAPLVLSDENRKLLTELSGSMTAPVREVVRAKVLLHYANGAENIPEYRWIVSKISLAIRDGKRSLTTH